MGGSIDVAVAALRGVLFAAALQAAGAAAFRCTAGALPGRIEASVRRLVIGASFLLILAALGRSVLEPARMAGSLAGVGDSFLWSLFWHSDVATAQALRILGATVLLAVTLRGSSSSPFGTGIGAGLVIVSFVLMGHTRTHAGSWWLGALLALHIATAAFWFGGLLPLVWVLRRGTALEARRVLDRFSSLAVRAVPVLFVAGVILAIALLGSVERIATPYGRIVVLKLTLFLALLGLAAANRYRWVPRVAESRSRDRLRRSVVAEIILLLGVVGATATMTTLYSPD